MKLNLGLYGTFIPTWMDNNELPDEEKIKIKYRRITGEMASDLIRFGLDQSMIFDNVSIVRKCVTEIEGLYSQNGEKICRADKLLKEAGVSGLVTEIGNHILTDSQMILENEKKNINEPTLVQ
jgi:hypothetical protein